MTTREIMDALTRGEAASNVVVTSREERFVVHSPDHVRLSIHGMLYIFPPSDDPEYHFGAPSRVHVDEIVSIEPLQPSGNA